jgi:hypothetical protein
VRFIGHRAATCGAFVGSVQECGPETRLAQSRRFVQYNTRPGQQDAEYEKALGDIRALINQYGEKGAYLWDPYLSAADILRTLFYCPYHNANLRALTAGQEYPSGSIPKPTLARSGASSASG